MKRFAPLLFILACFCTLAGFHIFFFLTLSDSSLWIRLGIPLAIAVAPWALLFLIMRDWRSLAHLLLVKPLAVAVGIILTTSAIIIIAVGGSLIFFFKWWVALAIFIATCILSIARSKGDAATRAGIGLKFGALTSGAFLALLLAIRLLGGLASTLPSDNGVPCESFRCRPD